jgi:adenylosuccinate lyase
MAELQFPQTGCPAQNVLAARYATPEVIGTFSEDNRIVFERDLWIAIMEEQAELGLPIPPEAIEDYRAVREEVDLDSIRNRERVTRHDVNARLQEFNALAGHQHAQKGMTSRDLTENVEQAQILRGLDLIRTRMVATLGGFAARAAEFSAIPMAGRSHNVAAQPIVLGKRFANFGEELIRGLDRITTLRDTYGIRGLKGPVGTQQDMLDLFEGDADKVEELELRIARRLGFSTVLGSVGQVYPRSSDFEVITALKQGMAGPANLALNIRLMAGQELMTEGFKPGQVGSNAMPHKMNARSSERIASLHALLDGYVTTAGILSGNQWNEGDVSCSAARRVIVPDSFYVADGILATTQSVLRNMGAYPAMVDRELQRFLPFLASTKVLMAAVKAGMGREDAHEAIKEHAVAAALSMREQGAENDLFDRLDADERLPVTKTDLLEATSRPLELTGLAGKQVAEFVMKVEAIAAKNPKDTRYQAEEVL